MKEPLQVDTSRLKSNPNYRLVFFDFEVLQFETMLTCYDVWTDQWLMARTPEKCAALLKAYMIDPRTVFAGYNNKNYDNLIAAACFEGYAQHEMWQLNRAIIDNREVTLRDVYYPEFKELRFRFPGVWTFVRRAWDCGHDMPPTTKTSNEGVQIPPISLKAWQKFNGIKVYRSPIPFDYPMPLNQSQVAQLADYNRFDVATTCKIAVTTLVGQFETRCGFGDILDEKKFSWHKTFTRLAEAFFVDKPEKVCDPDDVSYRSIVTTVPRCLKIEKYKEVLNFFNDTLGMLEVSGSLSTLIAGVLHTYALGGAHSDNELGVFKGNIMCFDVGGMYPSLMALFNLIGDSFNETKFKDTLAMRMKMDKSDSRREVFKRALNSSYGGMLDRFSKMYNPGKGRQVCILGQLFITDLIEKIEPYVTLIQSNTDGIYVLPNSERDAVSAKAAVKAFEKRTGLIMDVEYYREFYQRNVNNYIAIRDDGTEKIRGGAFRSWNHARPSVDQAMNRCEIMNVPFNPDDYSMEELSIVCTRDKNSRGFIIDGNEIPDATIDVVPVYPFQAQEIYTMKRDGNTCKARLCPDFAALSNETNRSEIDFNYYKMKKNRRDYV